MDATSDSTTIPQSNSNALDRNHPLLDDSKPRTDDTTDSERIGVRWYGRGSQRKDWMTTLDTPITGHPEAEIDSQRLPLTPLIDLLTKTTHPVAFQVLFQRKPKWKNAATDRQADLLAGNDTIGQTFINTLLDIGWDKTPDTLHGDWKKRYESIEEKSGTTSFTTNIRVLGITPPESTDDKLSLQSMRSVFDSITGPFYSVQGKRFSDHSLLKSRQNKHIDREFEHALQRTVTTGSGKRRPDITVSGSELLNFILIPSADNLTIEGVRGTRAEQSSRNPLPRPHQDLMREFRTGMSIGYAVDNTGAAESTPTRIPPTQLTTHYGRFGTTGAGKSKALINDILSLYEDTSGPTILIDPKGDGMTQNYMRAHGHKFGMKDLRENVIHFPVPDVLPGFSFFNLEPSLENGHGRADAVQRKADHYEELLKLVMGTEQYERATVAPTVIQTLIRTLFDEKHGRENGLYRESADYFAHKQLEHVLDQLWNAGSVNGNDEDAPKSTDEAVRRTIQRQLQLDAKTFSAVLGGVGNRLDAVSRNVHLRRVFNNTTPQFDFRDFLDEDTVILFDLGDLRAESARMMTGVILTNLDDALREQNGARSDFAEDYVVNLLVDEAASLVVSNIMNNLLEKGRSFRLSVGLSMQFPEQMEAEGGRKAYLNTLNNIGSTLVGKINVDREIARAMAHEEMDSREFTNRISSLPRGEWIASLPSPTFGETGPYPFSLKPLPIPAGHPESDHPLTGRDEARFEESLRMIHDRAGETFGVTSTETPTTETPAGIGRILNVADGELDIALAKIVRSVQLRTNKRAENGGVPVEAVDDELHRLFEDVNADAPTYEDLSTIRQRSRFLETTVDMEPDNLVIQLTDAGEEVATPDTGTVQSAGSHKHDAALEQIEAELTRYGFTVSILTQDGSEKPDARATHPELSETLAMEIETTTPENPAKILANLRKAQNAGELPLFVVRPGTTTTSWAERVDGILNPPVRELATGETRFYTTDANITFNGGATEEGGVTAVRPATDADSTQTIWHEERDELVLRDANGTEQVRLTSLADVSKGRVPATYSYDPAAKEYIVDEHGTRHIYDSKQAFESDWVRIKRPFVPETELETTSTDQLEYVIVILPSDGDLAVYANGRTYPGNTLIEAITASGQTADGELEALQQAHPPELDEIADDPDAVVARFADSHLVEEPNSQVTAADVYETYKEWAEGHDISPDTRSWFARRLSDQLSFERTTTREDGDPIRYYEGILLNEGSTAER